MERPSKIKHNKSTPKFKVSNDCASSKHVNTCLDKNSIGGQISSENTHTHFQLPQNTIPILKSNIPLDQVTNGANYLANNIVGYNPYCGYWNNFPGYFAAFQPNFFNGQLLPNASFVPFLNEEKFFSEGIRMRSIQESKALAQKNPKRKMSKVCRRKVKRIRLQPEDRGDGNFGGVVITEAPLVEEKGQGDLEFKAVVDLKEVSDQNASEIDSSLAATSAVVEPNRCEFWNNLQINHIPKTTPVDKQKMDEYLSQVLVEILGSNSHITEIVKKRHYKAIEPPEEVKQPKRCLRSCVSCYNNDDNSSVVSFVTAKIAEQKDDWMPKVVCYDRAAVKRVQKDVVRLHHTIKMLNKNMLVLYAIVLIVLVGNVLLTRYCRKCY